MKKISTHSIKRFIWLLLLTITIFSFPSKNHKQILTATADTEENESNKDMYDEAAAAQQFEFERTKDPALGYVPKDRLFAAYQAAERSKQIAASSRAALVSWVERGPNADVVGTGNGNTRNGVNPVASGRMRAIWVDLTDGTGNTVWAGGVDGGLWKTKNFKTSPATWLPVNDFFTNLAISSICQNPASKNIMYFCTGEAFSNFDAVKGLGVFKSTDSGATWNALASTSAYTNCTKILCDASGNVYLGTAGSGFLRSSAASGGGVWTAITPTGLNTSIADFEISSTGRLHLSCGLGNTASGGYRFTDIPATVASGGWTSATTAFPFPSGANCRVELACSANTLFALPSNNSALVTTIYKSTDGGANWAATATSPPNSGNTAFTNGQTWYCLAADINPSNANNVIVASLNCYSTNDGGNTWNQISDWVSGPTGQYVHADQHIVKWYATNEVLIGSDGGIFYSADQG
ncbi:MAG: exo-alpha-sialidase, partial [Bacteroidota bacterium]|nr:exo-alpha-sialidase [Bacteroidota bacterium]